MVRGPLPGGLGALRPAPRFGLLARNVTRGGAQVGGRFLGGLREIAQARQRRQGRRDFLARRSVVGGDARQLVLEAGLPLLVGRFLPGDPPFGGGDGRQHAGHPVDVEGAQAFGDARRFPPGRRGREQRLMGGRRGPLVLGRRVRVPARRLARRLQLREVRGGVVGIAGGRLRQPLAQLLGLVPGRPGHRARRLELVGAPDLAQNAAAVGRPVLDQQPGEAALGQDDGAQERVAVEPDQVLDAVVDGLHLLDLLDRLAVGPEPAELRVRRPDPALPVAAQRAGDLPRLARHPEPEHDPQVQGRVVHQLLVRLRGERRLAVEGVGDGLEDGRLAGPGVADDGHVVAAREVDGDGRPERPQPFDDEVQGSHVSSGPRSSAGGSTVRSERAGGATRTR